MNYLAHAYLSFNEPDILVGNLISDFVKGKNSTIPRAFSRGLPCTGKLIVLPMGIKLPKKPGNFSAHITVYTVERL
jgi:hypothetical protein